MRTNSGLAGREEILFLSVMAFLTLAYLALIWFTPSWLIGTPEYHWPVLRHGLPSRLPGALLLFGPAAAGGLLLLREAERLLQSRAGRCRLYLALFLLGLTFQLAPSILHQMGLLEFPLRIYLPDHTSYFTDAKKIEQLKPWLRTFPEHLPAFATHTRTHPPGAVLLFWAAQKTMAHFPRLSAAYVNLMPRSEEAMTKFELTPAQTAAGGLCALLLLLVAASTIPLTFALARLFSSSAPAAVLAALLFAAAPAFSAKTPVLDHLLALLLLASFWLSLTAITAKHIFRVVLAGLLLGAGLWLGLSLLAAFPLIVLTGAAALLLRRKEGAKGRDLILLGGCLLLLLAASAFFSLFSGGLLFELNYIEVYKNIMEVGWRLNNEVSGRLHAWRWIAFNPYEMFVWAGIPAGLLFLRGLFRSLRPNPGTPPPLPLPFTLGLVLFLVALDLSGRICYEASRLAWFCFPLMAVIAAAGLPSKEMRLLPLSLIISLQIISTLVFRLLF